MEQHQRPVVQFDQDYLFKVLVVGDFGVGKTAIVRRYTDGVFSQNYKITIGVDFLIKRLRWHPNKQITLQLWDIAGHERFGSLTRVYYKYATAAVFVYDLTRPATLESIVKWREDLRDKTDDKSSLPSVLLANKCDISQEWPDLDRFCRQHHIDAWFPTSAKEDVNVDEALNFLVERILEGGVGPGNSASSSTQRNDGILLEDRPTSNLPHSKTCLLIQFMEETHQEPRDPLFAETDKRRRFATVTAAGGLGSSPSSVTHILKMCTDDLTLLLA
ncbi:ras-related protein Rab-32B-like [Tropilaelaps mercedesae]|uniref:Ras-related protein Rab n=1 Tax=Tropilaelaps mercedesae TaxID=418985 RepID=A0A1V9XU28_9ACAR|nr:ras-related protein Rab-32B-like [Tropilaelaps mercedesae]